MMHFALTYDFSTKSMCPPKLTIFWPICKHCGVGLTHVYLSTMLICVPGCPYSCLTEGPITERLAEKQNKLCLLDFLITELEANRMIALNKPQLATKAMEVTAGVSIHTGHLPA